MAQWLIVPTNKLADLAALNEGRTDKQCTAIKTAGNVWVTGADKLQDSYWSEYHSFLNSLESFEGAPSFPVDDDAV